ncbi:MAG TPA: hypothetical protein GX522_02345 [Firmicutes bacterium]|nr:hypothetical protein [Bacillota bacterium]
MKNISMGWHLKDNLPIRVGKNNWRYVAMFQPGLWRVGKASIDLSFLQPNNYELVVADSRFNTALLSDALAEVVLYLSKQGIKEEDLTFRVVSDKEVLADEARNIVGSWVYGRIRFTTESTGKKLLWVREMGENPDIKADSVIYVVPRGDGSIHCLTDDLALANAEYDKQCGADIPQSDLVVAYDSAMKKVAPYGSEERTKRQVDKLKQLLKPYGKAILLAAEGVSGTYGDVVVADRSMYSEVLASFDQDRDKEWTQVSLIYDLAYTKIRNIL